MGRSLESRPFGRTGEQVSAIGLGGAYLDKYSLTDGVATVRRAVELGVTYFDTAPRYANGASEAILGMALEGRSESYLLATKVGGLMRSPDHHSPDALRAQLWGSLRALRRTQVDVLQVHGVEFACWLDGSAALDEVSSLGDSGDFANAPVMKVLDEAREQGLCRFLGVTADDPGHLARAVADVDVDICMAAYNYNFLFRDAAREVIPLARRKDVAFVNAGIMGPVRSAIGGLSEPAFTEVRLHRLDKPPGWVTPDLHGRLAKLYDLQRESGLPLVELAVRYPLANPDVAVVLVGAGSPAEIEESVAAAAEGPLPADLQQAIEELGPE